VCACVCVSVSVCECLCVTVVSRNARPARRREMVSHTALEEAVAMGKEEH
jgi:hypothetical protein